MNALSLSLTPPAPASAAPMAPDANPNPAEFARCLSQARDGEAATDAADTAEPQRDGPSRPAGNARAPQRADKVSLDTPHKAPGPQSASAAETPSVDAPIAVDNADSQEPVLDLAALLPSWTPMLHATPAQATPALVQGLSPEGIDAISGPLGATVTTAVRSVVAEGSSRADAAPAAPIAAPTLSRPHSTSDNATSAPETLATGDSKAAAQPATPRSRELEALGAVAPPLLAPAPPAPAMTAAAPVAAMVSAPVDSAGFAPALATQVRWLVQDGVQQAQLMLNPAEMGPVAVKIVLDGREARIDFSADVASTRSAIEASLPTLAAALDDSGLKLTGGGVHDGQAQRQPAWTARGGSSMRPATPGAGDSAGISAATARPTAARGLVDLIA